MTDSSRGGLRKSFDSSGGYNWRIDTTDMAYYEAFFFDFDGVLADSVEVKTRAFAELFEPYGLQVVARVVDHHRRHGGMTRADKFCHYYHEYIGKTLNKDELTALCQRFSELVLDKVVAAPEIRGAGQFLKKWCPQLSCFVISGTPEQEMREIIGRRGMAGHFKEVKGAPDSKEDNLRTLLKRYSLTPTKCCFFGDAESDYLAALACGVDFVGIVPGPDAPLVTAQPEITYLKDFVELEQELAVNG